MKSFSRFRTAGMPPARYRSDMEKLPDGEYYWQDLLGITAVTEDGQILGRIRGIIPTGSNDVYVCREGSREILLPAITEVIRKVDVEGRIMVVRLLDGL